MTIFVLLSDLVTGCFGPIDPFFLVVTEQEETDDQSEEERDRYPNPNSNFS